MYNYDIVSMLIACTCKALHNNSIGTRVKVKANQANSSTTKLLTISQKLSQVFNNAGLAQWRGSAHVFMTSPEVDDRYSSGFAWGRSD